MRIGWRGRSFLLLLMEIKFNIGEEIFIVEKIFIRSIGDVCVECVSRRLETEIIFGQADFVEPRQVIIRRFGGGSRFRLCFKGKIVLKRKLILDWPERILGNKILHNRRLGRFQLRPRGEHTGGGYTRRKIAARIIGIAGASPVRDA